MPQRMQTLTSQWSAAAAGHGALPIQFLNEIDDEDGPPLHTEFQYLEKTYSYQIEREEKPKAQNHKTSCPCLRRSPRNFVFNPFLQSGYREASIYRI
ncbi:hypothetical protein EV361DRAFT_957241 [Lentinula raphanica]|nr:hypothetical protein EV361DRAFT_957241 [Lentinula raphanica]